MANKILLGEDIQKKVLEGAKIVYDAVTSTLGPKASNVLLEKPYGRPVVTHDGVTVAKEIFLEDQFQNLGASLLIEAAEKTNDKAGDGTSTAILLAYEILSAALKQVGNGENPQILKRQLKDASRKVVEKLKEFSVPVSTKAEMENVARISSGSDEIGRLVALAFDKVGKDGLVSVDVGHSPQIEMEFREGFIIPKGYVDARFMTDPDTQKAELDDARVLVTSDEISSVNDFLKIIQDVSLGDKKILIVGNVSGAALATLIINRLQGNLKPIAINTPRGGDVKKGMMEDIAIFTGATLLTHEAGMPVTSATADHLGKVRKVVTDRDETLIIGGGGKKDEIEKRIAVLRKLVEDARTDFEREGLEERLSKLAGKVAVISAGGLSDTEIKEQRFRIEDAIHATKAALSEGVVPGGGVTLVLARVVLAGKETAGERLLYSVLDRPMMKLLANAGLENHHKVFEAVMESPAGHTFDLLQPEGEMIGEALKIGVVDPLLVVRLALENAVSVACEILTTGAGIIEIKEDKEPGLPKRPRI